LEGFPLFDLERYRQFLPTTARSISEADLEALLTQMVTVARVGLERLNVVSGVDSSKPNPKSTPKTRRLRRARRLSFRELIRGIPPPDRYVVTERAAILEIDGGLERTIAEDLALSEWGNRRPLTDSGYEPT
jgi:hypothetical protein